MENKKNSIQMSEAELQKAIDQIPQEYVQEAMAHIPEEDIEKISQMKEINIENLEKLSAGLSHKTKDFLKFLGAGAAIISIGTGGYLIGKKVGRRKGYGTGYTRGKYDGLINGFSMGEKEMLRVAHHEILELTKKILAVIMPWLQ